MVNITNESGFIETHFSINFDVFEEVIYVMRLFFEINLKSKTCLYFLRNFWGIFDFITAINKSFLNENELK